jgi:hypothetical protein
MCTSLANRPPAAVRIKGRKTLDAHVREMAHLWCMVLPPQSVDNLGHMWPHFVNLLSRVWNSFLHAMGTTGLGFFTPLVVLGLSVILTLIFIFFRDGKKKMKEHWEQTALVTTIVTLAVMMAVYSPILCWNLIKRVYSDHYDLSAVYVRLVKENKGLKLKDSTLVDPSASKGEISQLKANNTKLQSSLDKATKPPAPYCSLWNHYQYPNPHVDSGAKSGTAVFMLCNYKFDAPWTVTVNFDRDDFFNETGEFPGSGITPFSEKSGSAYITGSSMAPVPAGTPIVVNVETKSW